QQVERRPGVEDQLVRPLAVDLHVEQHVSRRQELERDRDRLRVRLGRLLGGAGGRGREQADDGEELGSGPHGYSPLPSGTTTVSVLSPRRTSTRASWPGRASASARARSFGVSTSVIRGFFAPAADTPTAVILSPGFSPALAAGPSGSTALTNTPSLRSSVSTPRNPRGRVSKFGVIPISPASSFISGPSTSSPPCPPWPIPFGAGGSKSSGTHTSLSAAKS